MQPVMSQKTARRVLRCKVAGGVLDFIGIAICTALIMVLIVLLINLVTWVKTDITEVFAGYFRNVTDAVIMGR